MPDTTPSQTAKTCHRCGAELSYDMCEVPYCPACRKDARKVGRTEPRTVVGFVFPHNNPPEDEE